MSSLNPNWHRDHTPREYMLLTLIQELTTSMAWCVSPDGKVYEKLRTCNESVESLGLELKEIHSAWSQYQKLERKLALLNYFAKRFNAIWAVTFKFDLKWIVYILSFHKNDNIFLWACSEIYCTQVCQFTESLDNIGIKQQCRIIWCELYESGNVNRNCHNCQPKSYDIFLKISKDPQEK